MADDRADAAQVSGTRGWDARRADVREGHPSLLRGARGGIAARDRLEREETRFHEKVREGYLRLARREVKRIVVIDASRPLDEVVRAALGNLEGLFNVKLAVEPI